MVESEPRVCGQSIRDWLSDCTASNRGSRLGITFLRDGFPDLPIDW
jgi:hypothetical protein